jgi:hypothetical protein
MAEAIVLNNIDHHDLRFVRRYGAVNGDNINQVRVFPTEFLHLFRNYPIFFRRSDDAGYQSVAILGFDKDENLFLTGEEPDIGWTPRYIPALQSRGPFSIGIDKENRRPDGEAESLVLVDPENPLISRSEGEPLFLKHGGNTALLNNVTQVLRTLQQGVELETAMFRAFEDAGLLASLDIDIRLDDVTSYKIPDLFTIRREALHNLSGPALAALNSQGWLELAFCVLSSQANFDHMIETKNKDRIIF